MPSRMNWLWALVALEAAGALAVAQGFPEEPVSYTRQRIFRIPFQTDPGERRLREIQLYYSVDSGRSWQAGATAPPEQGDFKFVADRDGLYWFAVRTVDTDGRANPPAMDAARPALRVVVDTQPPVIDLRALPARDGLAGVAWEVRDANLDIASIRLEYRARGSPEWIPLRIEPAASSQSYWRPTVGGPLEVRLRAHDRAENAAEKLVLLPAVSEPRAADAVAVPRAPGPPRPGDPAVRMVNTRRITLNYEIRDKGPSGISSVDLWCTTDGRTWVRYPTNSSLEPPLVLENVPEGLYGFTLVVRSGAGRGGSPPQPGEAPQVWVEVDVTEPKVRLGAVEVGHGPDTGRLTITWDASDKNLLPEPITLSYAKDPQGPWTPIVPKLPNTGRYVWQMPTDVPYAFYVKVEAADRAGNVGSAQTARPINVDLHEPKGVILDVGPAKETGPSRPDPPH